MHWRCASFIGGVPHSLEVCFISLYRTCVLVCTLCLHRYLCICLLLGLIHSDLGPPEKKMLPIFCQNVTNFPRLDFFLQKKAVLKLFSPGLCFRELLSSFLPTFIRPFSAINLNWEKGGSEGSGLKVRQKERKKSKCIFIQFNFFSHPDPLCSDEGGTKHEISLWLKFPLKK